MANNRWRDAMERAKAASDAAGFTEEARKREKYLYAVDFTIARELVDVRELSIENGEEGCHVHLSFSGNHEAKDRVLNVISALPSMKRSYRLTYEKEVES